MTFNINDSINNLADRLTGNQMLHGILGHPIYVSMLLAFCMVIIVVIVMGEFDAYYITRIAMYAFIASTCVIFLHNKIIDGVCRDRVVYAAQGSLLSGLEKTGAAEQPSEYNIEDSFTT